MDLAKSIVWWFLHPMEDLAYKQRLCMNPCFV